MLKVTALVIAAAIAGTSLLPSVAAAADTGSCHYCDMEPIIVKGDRKKKAKIKTSGQQLQTTQSGQSVRKIRR